MRDRLTLIEPMSGTIIDSPKETEVATQNG
jgi:hypothetical protein